MYYIFQIFFGKVQLAAIAQLGERKTEDLKVPGSIPGPGMIFLLCLSHLEIRP